MHRLLVLLLLLFTATAGFTQKLPVNYYRGQAAIDNGDLIIAAIWLDSAITSNPRIPTLFVKRGEVYFRDKSYQQAIKMFQQAESLRNSVASYWLARTFAVLSDTTNTFLELEKHLSSPVKMSEPRIQLDTAFVNLRSSQQWKSLWMNSWYSTNELLLADVEYHFSRNEWNHALDYLNERMHGRSVNHRLFALRGEAYFNIGSYKASEADFAQALRRSRRNHTYMAWLARANMVQGKAKKAIRLLSQAIDQSGGEPEYYKWRSQAFASDMQHGKAIDDIKFYLTFYPKNIEAIAMLAGYAFDSGRDIEALLQLGALIKIQPNIYEHYLMRAKIYGKSGHWAMAELDLNEAINLTQKNADAYLTRGICRINLGKSSDACKDFSAALKFGSYQAQELIYKHCRK